MKTIGIFDSGVGGVRFAKALKAQHSDIKLKVLRDEKNMPYGDRTPREIQILTEAAIKPLLNCDLIVIACNTATAYAMDYLRKKYPAQLFVGFEPALKIASAYTKTGQVAVLATPATLKSSRYLKLKQAYGTYLKIYEPDVSTLAHQIETNSVSWLSLKRAISQLNRLDVDCLVLGCTHYHLIEKRLKSFARKNTHIITPTSAVIRQIEKLLDL